MKTTTIKQFTNGITWIKNTGIQPVCGAHEVIVIRFGTGETDSVITKFPEDFYWKPDIDCPIIDFVILPVIYNASDLIDALDEIAAQEKEALLFPEWIDVTIQLPELNDAEYFPSMQSQEVLVLKDDGSITVAYARQWLDEDDPRDHGSVEWIAVGRGLEYYGKRYCLDAFTYKERIIMSTSILDLLDEAERNGKLPINGKEPCWDLDLFLNDLDLESLSYYIEHEKFSADMSKVPLIDWICTDTSVGIYAYYLNHILVAVSLQAYRTCTADLFWVSEVARNNVRKFIVSLSDEQPQPFKLVGQITTEMIERMEEIKAQNEESYRNRKMRLAEAHHENSK